ncbi:hypothetical protein ACX27_11995 [Nostoc piscinale CENA21]|uniref:Lipoprotein n=1 Tax=Nostoc piscinale CENA21 TaxID=224013 RepID=A0A0M5MID2_9NOSO|nr:hypothetical protein [Nostoc piscinale]ALF53400.1 hypothetical protein ACX27_11995 [Nostoc piscinale CENA21]
MSAKSIKSLTLFLVFSIISLGILTACIHNKSETTTASESSLSKPNVILEIKSQTGTCPKTVGLWAISLLSEGGGEYTVVADTRPIANPARLVASGERFVEYEAILRESYASCIGSANSQEFRFYNFQFRNGKVYFRVDLPAIINESVNGTPYIGIAYKELVASRPYVRWKSWE